MLSSYNKKNEQTTLKRINRIARIICETQSRDACSVTSDDKAVTFHFKITDSIATPTTIHRSEYPIIPVALQLEEFDEYINQSTHHYPLFSKPKEKIVVPLDDKTTLATILNQLITRELETILVSAQNYEYFLLHGKVHPHTGKGATAARNVTKLDRLFALSQEGSLEQYSIVAMLTSEDFIQIKAPSVKNLTTLRQYLFSSLSFLSEDDIQIDKDTLLVKIQIDQFLKQIAKLRVNYQGVYVINSEGDLAMAERLNLGYAAAGGHSSDPYHPKLGAVGVELKAEFGLELKDPKQLEKKAFIITQQAGLAIIGIQLTDCILTKNAEKYCRETGLPFQAEEKEFKSGTEKFVSLKNLKEKNIPLRSLFSIEYYLAYEIARLNQLLSQREEFKGCKIEINHDYRIVQLPGDYPVHIVEKQFGEIKLSLTEKAKKTLTLDNFKSVLPESAVIRSEEEAIIIDRINPVQFQRSMIRYFNRLDGKEEVKEDKPIKEKKLTEKEAKELIQRLDDKVKTLRKEDDEKEQFLVIINRLKQRRKIKISREKTLRATKEIGEDNELDIDFQSKQNLKNTRERLRQGLHLSATEKMELKDHDYLTAKEKVLYHHLLKKEYFIQHATLDDSYASIKASGNTLFDPQEALRRGASMRKPTTTPYGGIGNNIFFGWGTYSSSLPYFVQQRENKNNDYCIIRINYTKLMREHPELLFGIWCSGHFYHFSQAKDQLKMEEDQYLRIDDKTFLWEYQLHNRYSLKQQQPFKYLIYKSIDVRHQKLSILDEVASGHDILPLFCLLFIERLRYMGGSFRQSLLDNPHNDLAIDYFMETAFRVDDFEIKLPTQFPLDNPYTEIITPRRRKEMTTAVKEAAEQGEIKVLESLKEKHYPLFGFMYEDAYYYDGSPAVLHPVLAAIKNKQKKSLEWLIKAGALQSAISLKPINEPFCTEVLLAGLETIDLEIIDILIKAGMDFNISWHWSYGYLDWPSDPFNQRDGLNFIFQKIIILTVKTKHFSLLDYMMEKLPLFKEPSQTILHDLGRYGNEEIAKRLMPAINEEKNEIHCNGILRYAILSDNSNDYIVFLFKELKSKKLNILELLWLAFSKDRLEVVDYLINDFPEKPISLEMLSASYSKLIDCNDDFYKYIVHSGHEENDIKVIYKISWLLDKKLIDEKNVSNLMDCLTKHEHMGIKPQPGAIKILQIHFSRPEIPVFGVYPVTYSRRNICQEILTAINLGKISIVDKLLPELKDQDYYLFFIEACHYNQLPILKLLIARSKSLTVLNLCIIYKLSFGLESTDSIELWESTTRFFTKQSLFCFLVGRITMVDGASGKGVHAALSTEKALEMIQWMESKGFDADQHVSDEKSFAELILENYNKGTYIQKGLEPKLGILFNYLLQKMDKTKTCYQRLLAYVRVPEIGVEILMNAMEKGEDELIQWLLEQGVNLNSLENSRKISPLECACRMFQYEPMNLSKAILGLLDSGADPNLYGEESPLSILCNYRRTSKILIEALLERGAKITEAILQKCHLAHLSVLQAKIKLTPEEKVSAETVIFLVTASSSWYHQRKTKDVDYAIALQKKFESKSGSKMVLIKQVREPEQILKQMKANSPPAVLHLFINPKEGTGTLFKPADLEKFKTNGIKIIITPCAISEQKEYEKMLSYLEWADEISFQKEADKAFALKIFSPALDTKLKLGQVLSISDDGDKLLSSFSFMGKSSEIPAMLASSEGVPVPRPV